MKIPTSLTLNFASAGEAAAFIKRIGQAMGATAPAPVTRERVQSATQRLNNVYKNKPPVKARPAQAPKKSGDGVFSQSKQGKWYWKNGTEIEGLPCPVCGEPLPGMESNDWGYFVKCAQCSTFINESKNFSGGGSQPEPEPGPGPEPGPEDDGQEQIPF